MRSSGHRVCALSPCNKTVYRDPLTGQEHDFCGRGHATLYRQQQQQLQHQRAATATVTVGSAGRTTGGKASDVSGFLAGALRNHCKSNPKPSGPPTSAANGASPPSQKLRVTDTMVLFWTPPCVFTQWEPASFKVDGVEYCCAEQYMMACKANVFGDNGTWGDIMRTNDPAQQKRLGREVAGYNHDVWSQYKVQFVLTGNYSKFTQNPDMCDQLLATGDKMLAEASPHDKVWGIGMDAFDPDVERPERWRGQNLLGKVLMYVRTKIRWERPDLAARPQVQEAAAAMEAEHGITPSRASSVSAAGPAMTADSLGAFDMTAIQTQLIFAGMAFPRAPRHYQQQQQQLQLRAKVVDYG
eukprot:g11552.t1